MSANDLLALLPLIVLTAAVVAVMLAIAFYRNHLLTLGLTLLGLALAFASLFVVPPHQVTPLLVVDRYALFFTGLLLAAAFAVALLCHGYLERTGDRRQEPAPTGARGDRRREPAPTRARGERPEELYLLLLLGTVGSAVLVAANHFASFFLGLEVLSVSLYAMVPYTRSRRDSVEAGVKYLVLAGASSAILLFGMALVYSQLGTMEFPRIASSAAMGDNARSLLFLTGGAMVIAAFGFKLAVVPFHLWTPDVYQGAPAPVTAFVATLSKGAVFALLLRLFTQVDVRAYGSLFVVFVVIAVASMLVGNLLALLQSNVKRILAYSSIAHLGYLLVAFLASGALAVTAVAFYLVAYFITTLGAFGVMTLLSTRDRDAEDLEDYRGLFWRRPWLGAAFTAMLLSLAGIPLTAGFIGKFYVAAAGVGSALWLLVIVLAVTSSIGLFYYLRVVAAVYAGPAEAIGPATAWGGGGVPLPIAGAVTVAVLALLLIALGVYPTAIIGLIEGMATGVG